MALNYDANVCEGKFDFVRKSTIFFLLLQNDKKLSLCPQSSAVIRMMQNFLGVETFRKGIQVLISRLKIL